MNSLDYAKSYLNEGICVLPVRPYEKRPYMGNWHKYMTVQPTPANLELWFKSLSGAGVGAVTGFISDMVVLDIDTRFSGSVTELLQKYPTDRVSRSGSGGYHLFYKYPKSFGSKIPNAVNLIPGVDLRADGGFIVLPPTLHPSGNLYKWESEGEMGIFPVEILSSRKTTSDSSNTWLQELMRGVTSGERNDAAAKLSGYLFGKGLNLDVVESIMVSWNEKNDPPMNTGELLTTVKSIARSNYRNLQVEFVDTPVAAPTGPAGFGVVNLKDYFSLFCGEGATWLIDDWLPMDSIAFMISPPESYKTWLLLDLAVSVASGLPFLGKYPVNKQGPVLLIQQEDSHTGVAERLSVIIQSRMDLAYTSSQGEWEVPKLPDLPIFIHPDRMLKFNDVKVMDSLEQLIATIQPSIVLIDPLYSAASTENYMASAAENMMRLKSLRDKYHCSFVVAHHSKKNVDPDSTAREDAWGSQFLNAFLEAGWQIRRSTKLADNEVVVRRHSKTMGNFVPVVLKFDISTNSEIKYEVTTEDYISSASLSKSDTDIMKVLLSAGKPMTQTEISGALGKNKSTISRQIKKLKSDNIINIMENGKCIPIIKED